MKPLCDRCQFWRRAANLLRYDDHGDCRRRAPRETVASNDPETRWSLPATAVWPETKPDDFCGEFEAVQPMELV